MQPRRPAAVRAKRSHYLPTVLTPEEAKSVIQQLSGEYRLITEILYGSGLRLPEAMQLRVKDLDFAQQQINILEAKGRNSRTTMMPSSIIERLQEHLVKVKRLHQQDLERKYPNVERQWIWQGNYTDTGVVPISKFCKTANNISCAKSMTKVRAG